MSNRDKEVELRVPYVDFPAQFDLQRKEILAAVERAFARGDYILGKEVEAFERRFAELCEVRYGIGVGNGTDALLMALKALEIGPGDEVITAPNSWISSASCIALAGVRPIFVDVCADLNMNPELIEAAITARTRAILPVHLTGRVANMDPILDIATRYSLYVIEDAAQAVGAKYRGKTAGSFGHIGCFSLHPLKNLNAMGDGGIVVTNNEELAQKLKLLRNHGLCGRDDVVMWGLNSRLDTVQAAILNCRFDILKDVTETRRRNARRYQMYLADVSEFVTCPVDHAYEYAVYHLFVVQCDRRDALQAFLASRGIDAPIHYPTPIHLKTCCRYLGYRRGDFPEVERQASRILSLPVHHCLSLDQIDYVCDSIDEFYSDG